MAATASASRSHQGDSRARHLYDSMGYREVGVERVELVLLLELASMVEPDP